MIKEELFSKIGIGTDWIVAGLAGIALILLVMQIVSMVKLGKMKKQYKQFMSGSDGATMEEVITKRFSEIDELKENDKQQSEGIKYLQEKFKFTYFYYSSSFAEFYIYFVFAVNKYFKKLIQAFSRNYI